MPSTGRTDQPPLSFHLHRLLPCLLLVGLAAGEKVTFDDHVFPIFEKSCLNCHNPDKAKGGLDLSSYPGTLKGGSGGKIVEAGDGSSKLLAVVRRTSEPVMPPEGDAIPSSDIKTLESWIVGGLLENLRSEAKKPTKPKFNPLLTLKQPSAGDGPAPLPEDLLLEPVVVAPRASAIHAMALSPTAPVLAITGQGQVILHHSGTHELLGILPFPEGEPISLKFTPDGRYLIVGGGVAGKSGTTVSFDVVKGERVLEIGKEFDAVLSSDLHPSLSRVVTGSPSKLIKFWNSEDGSSIQAIKKHTDWVTSVDFSPDGILLATADRNGGLWVWEAATGTEFHTLRGHQAGINEAAFRSDSNLLASASADGTVRIWEMNGGKEVKKLDAHPGGVLALSWGGDGRFATAGRDRTVKLWKADFSPGQVIKGLKDIPTALVLDTSHEKVFVADYQGHIAIHEIKEGTQVGSLEANPPSIGSRLALHRTEKLKSYEKLDASKKTLNEKQALVSKLDDQLKQAGKQLEETEATHAAASREIKESTTEQTELRGKIAALGAEEVQAASKVGSQRIPLRDLNARLAQAKAQRQKEAELKAQILADLEQAKSIADEQQRQARMAKLQEQLVAHGKQQDQTRQSISTLEQELPPLLQSLAEAEAHVSRIKQQRDSIQAQIAATTEKRNGLQAKLKQTKQRIAELKQKQQTLGERLSKERGQFEKLKEAVEKHQKQARMDEKKLRFWERAQLRSTIHTKQEEMVSREGQIEDLKQRFTETSQSVAVLEIDLAENQSRLQQIEHSIASEPANLEDLRKAQDAAGAKIQSLNNRLESTRSKLKSLRQDLDGSFSEFHRLRQELELHRANYGASAAGTE